jgi:hypothetical protein
VISTGGPRTERYLTYFRLSKKNYKKMKIINRSKKSKICKWDKKKKREKRTQEKKKRKRKREKRIWISMWRKIGRDRRQKGL